MRRLLQRALLERARSAWFVRTSVAACVATPLLQGGCAKPCFDDGLDQGGCPAAETTADTTAAEASGTASGGPNTATDATDPTVGTGGADAYTCPELDEVLLPQTPTFQLVVDRSGSMDEDFGGTSRWDAMVDTLVGGEGVVTELQSEIRFGLTLYSNDGMSCPSVDSLAPQLDAADEITTALGATGPAGDTPTGESLEIATALVLDDEWEGEKVLVLATDGEPDTCAVPEPMGDAQIAEVRGVAVDAVATAYDAGIRTFVISVGPELAEEHLQALANAGAGATDADPAPFWVADDTAALVAAFDAIVAGIRPCDFDLSMPLLAEVAPSCAVTVNDSPVGYQDADGWELQDEDTLRLVGTACEAIQYGVAVVAMTCTCEAQ